MTHDLFDLSDLEIQDGRLKINRVRSSTMVVACTKFEVDILNICGEFSQKKLDELFHLSDLIIQDGSLKFDRLRSPLMTMLCVKFEVQ